MSLEIRLAYDGIEQVKELFIEYSTTLNTDLAYQDFSNEFDNLPDKYSLPKGRLYIAIYNSELAGCIALRPHENNCCEMKRLYVRPKFRGLNIGIALVDKVINDAIYMRYDKMLLDSLPSMSSAIALYKKMGFYEIEPYCHSPIKGTIFLEKDLRKE